MHKFAVYGLVCVALWPQVRLPAAKDNAVCCAFAGLIWC
jgi:hypothetical protein